jgi:dipeptidyl aminopeptidase/acylaminoacyl peptidase
VEGGEETQVLDSVSGGNWEVVEQGIYFIPTPGADRRYFIKFHDFATDKIKPVAELDKQLSWGISVSPDGRSILYSQLESASSDLMLVEDFR